MRLKLALAGALVLIGLGLFFWGHAAGSAPVAGLEQDLAAERRERVLEREQARVTANADAVKVSAMAQACRVEGDAGFDAGYKLGVARCGVVLPD